MTELNKLQAWLLDHKVDYERHDKYPTDEIKEYLDTHNGEIGQFERHQIIVYHRDASRWFDVICHWGSYGYEAGLLEAWFEGDEDVVGWLTAEQVIDRIKGEV